MLTGVAICRRRGRIARWSFVCLVSQLIFFCVTAGLLICCPSRTYPPFPLSLVVTRPFTGARDVHLLRSWCCSVRSAVVLCCGGRRRLWWFFGLGRRPSSVLETLCCVPSSLLLETPSVVWVGDAYCLRSFRCESETALVVVLFVGQFM